MKIIDEIEQNTPEWVEARKGKITGSKLGDIVVKRGTGRKVGFYKLIAERLGMDPDGENPMERGHRLEDEAVAEFESRYGMETEKVGLCVSDVDDRIALSPDRLIKSEDGRYTGAVEVKCLASARHIQAIVENVVPDEYEFQMLQYFIVNPDLETLYFVFYDPRFVAKPFFCKTIERTEVINDKCGEYLAYQLRTLSEVDEIINQLEFN